MDLDTTRYQTFDDLFEYCRRVASAVGLICIRIFGCTSDRRARVRAQPGRGPAAHEHPARHAGRSRARPRVSAARGSGGRSAARSTICARGQSSPIRPPAAGVRVPARARLLSRARSTRGPTADRRRLVAAEIMRAVYFETLRRIERSGYDVFTARVRVPRPQQALIALQAVAVAGVNGYDIVVIGAGFAGLSAAVRLAEARRARARARGARRGSAAARPRLPIARPASSSTTASTCCSAAIRDTFAFLRRHRRRRDSVASQPQLRVTMIDRAGRRSRLDVPGAAGAAASARRRHRLGRARLARSAVVAADGRAAAASRRPRAAHGVRRPMAASPGETVEDWLIRNGQTRAASRDAVGAAGAGGAQPVADEAAAPPFARVLAEMFGSRSAGRGDRAADQAAARDVRRAGARVHRGRGGEVRTGAPAHVRDRRTSASRSRPAASAGVAAVVSRRAVVRARRALRRRRRHRSRDCSSGRAAMASSPIVTVNLWFDRPVIGRAVHRPARARRCSGCSTSGECSAAARRICRWSRAAPTDWSQQTNDELDRASRTRELIAARSRRRAARGSCDATVVREPRATFSLAPGQPPRPGDGDAGARAVSGRRLDRYRPAGYDRKRRPQRPSRLRSPCRSMPSPIQMNSIVVHYKELALKGKNRPWFIQMLVPQSADGAARASTCRRSAR